MQHPVIYFLSFITIDKPVLQNTDQHLSFDAMLLNVADLDLGLKRDAAGAVDGSSLEALLKGEPLDRRSAMSDSRAPEDDSAAVEPPATSTTTHTSSGRVRKV